MELGNGLIGRPGQRAGLAQENKMKTEHSPLPWAESKIENGRLIYDFSGDEIAQVNTARGIVSVSNRALIVRAVNSHEALVEAAQLALDYLGRIEEGSEGAELRDVLRAAIAKAQRGR